MNGLGKHQIVLLGIGHTNAHIVRRWKMSPFADCQLICISNFPQATYSGMLPGVLAGQYQPEAMAIDLVRLVSSCGGQLILDDPVAIDVAQRQIHFASSRPPLAYDWLSIGIGSQPNMAELSSQSLTNLVAIKPMQTFLTRLTAALRDRKQLMRVSPDNCLRVAIVGGGAGSLEIAFCLRERHRQASQSASAALDQILADFTELKITICTAADRLGSGLLPGTIDRVESALKQQGIDWKTKIRVVGVNENMIQGNNGQTVPADLVIWATQAAPPTLLENIPLPKDERGFLLTKPTLQSIGEDRVFVVGDSGSLSQAPTPKAGVYAVRQGPVLWENLQRAVATQPLIEYQPQTSFLKLLNLGDGRAILEYKGISSTHRLWWWLKNRIDVKFMKMYQDFSVAMRPAIKNSKANEESTMRCVGCGGKVPGVVLREALTAGSDRNESAVDESPQDVSYFSHAQSLLAHTVDYFVAPLPDPWIAGRMAAINALSDLYASGCRPESALMIAQIPWGEPRAQQRQLHQALVGIKHELSRAGARLIGGHTIEGDRLALGLAVTGQPLHGKKVKQDVRPGDCLILTKPLGTGCLLAAWQQHQLAAEHYQALLSHLLIGNEVALEIWERFPVSAITDITGFGLAGHAREMLSISDVHIELGWQQISALPGFQQLSEQGVESTLTAANRLDANLQLMTHKSIPMAQTNLLFDPQTCGGLLCAIPEKHAEELVQWLRAHGHSHATRMGRVIAANGAHGELRLFDYIDS